MGSTQVQVLRKALNTWEAYVDHRHKKYAAQHLWKIRLISGAWRKWRGSMAAAHAKEAKAQQLAAVALRRMQNQVLYMAFTQWRAHVHKMQTLKVRSSTHKSQINNKASLIGNLSMLGSAL